MGKEPHPGTFSVEEAHERFEELLKRAAAGEEVIIGSGDDALKLALVQAKPKPRREPGKYKGLIDIPDSFFDPMTEEELALWEGGDV